MYKEKKKKKETAGKAAGITVHRGGKFHLANGRVNFVLKRKANAPCMGCDVIG
jgi:hypothetical protein